MLRRLPAAMRLPRIPMLPRCQLVLPVLLLLCLGPGFMAKTSPVSSQTRLPPLDVFAAHAPMHPQTGGQVTVAARATGNLDRVVLRVQEFALSNGPNGSRVQTPRGAERIVRACDPAAPAPSITCGQNLSGFPAGTLVRLSTEAVAVGGATTREAYFFAAGTYPWPRDPIPIRATGAPQGRLDVVFVPDTDITLASFVDQLDQVQNLYFRYPAYRGTPGRPNRAMYNLYYTREFGNIYRNSEGRCRIADPANMRELMRTGDVIAILHRTRMRDCRIGRRFGSEIDHDKTLIHESGHALFNLSDEYCCDTSYPRQQCVPNIYRSLQACRADAPNLGVPASNCTQLSKGRRTLQLWRIDHDDTNGCIMGPAQHNRRSDHGVSDNRRINWRFNHCIGGNCFPARECP